MAENRITKRWLKNHWTYSWWKYLLVIALSVMGIDMLFTSTAYRPPEEKKIELYVCNEYVDSIALQEALWPLFSERYPDQEELTVMNINLTSDDMYAAMQFSTYVAAQQGDVLLLPEAEVAKLAAEGADVAFLELTPFIESGVIDPGDIDLSSGMMKSEAGEMGLYAIPADTLYGLTAFYNIPDDSMLCLTSYGGNDEHAAGLLNLLLERYRTEKPEGYGEADQAPATIFN